MILFCSLWIIEGKEKVKKTEHNDKIAVSEMFPAHDRVVKKGKGNIKAINSVYLLTYLFTYEKRITEKCRCGEAISGAAQKKKKTSKVIFFQERIQSESVLLSQTLYSVLE